MVSIDGESFIVGSGSNEIWNFFFLKIPFSFTMNVTLFSQQNTWCRTASFKAYCHLSQSALIGIAVDLTAINSM